MGTEDKLYKKIQQAAQNGEPNTFPAMEKVWTRVEEKLDKKEDKKAIVIWKKIAIAASFLVFITIGYQITKKEEIIVIPENTIVKEDKRENPLENKEQIIVEKEKPEIDKKKIDAVFSKENEVQSFTSNSNENSNEETLIIISDSNNVNKIIKDTITDTKIITSLLNDTTILNYTKSDPIVEFTSNNNIVKGIVSDKFGPLPSASISIKGTNIGTITNFNGEFQIPAKKGDQLVIQYVSMKDKIITIGNSNSLTVTMEEDFNSLNEVVVVAHGMTKKRSYTSAVSVVKPQEISAKPNAKLTQSLQGSVAGVNISPSSATLGSSTRVVIRGTASLKGNQEPLFVINGIPVKRVNIEKIDSKDIESVEVLKNGVATSLYGSRGSNGVILIKTKQKLSKKQLKKLLKENKTEKEDTKREIEISQEEYESFVENPFTNPKMEPLSTFSIDVDNASYTNVRRFINQGQTVPKDAVRVEEMINFFEYEYQQPKNEHPFAIETEYSDCPWNTNHKLVKIGLQGKNIEDKNLPASNFVYLIDVSGSMSDANKLPLLKQSVKVLVDKMRKEDKVSIVVYAGAAGLVLEPTPGNEKETILNAFEKLNAGGSTAGGQGIELAYKIAQENFIKGGNNRVILATDGDFNVGASSDKDMQQLIEEKRKSGVFLTCLGFGMNNYKDSKMEILADKGNGNYAYIDNIQEANRFLGKEFKGSMFAIAKDVKIQIEFNPKHVQSYRLIGYENRKLRPEDFKNDAIDAGELGSGHTVTALYEIIPTGIKSNYTTETDALKYTTNETKSDAFTNELATVKFRYKKPDGDKSIEMIQVIENNPTPIENASEDFKFAAAVAWFGLKLRDSKLVTNKASEAIIELVKKGKSKDEAGYKAEFIRLVEAVK